MNFVKFLNYTIDCEYDENNEFNENISNKQWIILIDIHIINKQVVLMRNKSKILTLCSTLCCIRFGRSCCCNFFQKCIQTQVISTNI